MPHHPYRRQELEDARARLHQGHGEQQQKLTEERKARSDLEDKCAKLQAERDRLLDKIRNTTANIESANTGESIVGVAKLLGLSPGSMSSVEKLSINKKISSEVTADASTPPKGTRNRFLERVAATLTPIIKKVCSFPKFKDGKSDIGGVAATVVGRLARAKSRRRLNFQSRPRGISEDLDTLLKEMATSWRTAFRNHERHVANGLLQLALTSIDSCRGRTRGRVSEWLGPLYFNEIKKIERGSPVRLLRQGDPAKFRLRFANTSLSSFDYYSFSNVLYPVSYTLNLFPHPIPPPYILTLNSHPIPSPCTQFFPAISYFFVFKMGVQK